jgi:cation transport regulator ChaB
MRFLSSKYNSTKQKTQIITTIIKEECDKYHDRRKSAQEVKEEEIAFKVARANIK